MRKMHIRSAIEHAVEASQHQSGIAGAQIKHQAGILSTLAHLRAEPERLNESRCTRFLTDGDGVCPAFQSSLTALV